MPSLITCIGRTRARINWLVSLVSPSEDRGFGVLHGFCGCFTSWFGWFGWLGWLDMPSLTSWFGRTRARMSTCTAIVCIICVFGMDLPRNPHHETNQPTNPSVQPTNQPTNPSVQPTNQPTNQPTRRCNQPNGLQVKWLTNKLLFTCHDVMVCARRVCTSFDFGALLVASTVRALF